MHRTKQKKGLVAFKIDLEKVYDRVDWDFLEKMLNDFGLPGLTISLIVSCVWSSSLSLLWNGDKFDGFSAITGPRQEDPLSPYLFVLVMEKVFKIWFLRVNGCPFLFPRMTLRYLTCSPQMTSYFFPRPRIFRFAS